jgi:hypothetical protein
MGFDPLLKATTLVDRAFEALKVGAFPSTNDNEESAAKKENLWSEVAGYFQGYVPPKFEDGTWAHPVNLVAVVLQVPI